MEISNTRQPVVSWRRALASGEQAQLSVLVEATSLQAYLQEAGETILAIAEDDPADYVDICTALAARLTERAWLGDRELAELLVAIAEGQPSARRRIRAELEGVSDLLEGPVEMSYGGVLDCETGDAWPSAILDDWVGDGDAPDPDDDPDRYLFIPNEGSREAWEDMREFAATVEEPVLRDRLLDAIDGRGAFSRFRRVLDNHDAVRSAWHTYSAETRVGRARQWLADAGFDALPPRR